jgi:hypothetical protein
MASESDHYTILFVVHWVELLIIFVVWAITYKYMLCQYCTWQIHYPRIMAWSLKEVVNNILNVVRKFFFKLTTKLYIYSIFLQVLLNGKGYGKDDKQAKLQVFPYCVFTLIWALVETKRDSSVAHNRDRERSSGQIHLFTHLELWREPQLHLRSSWAFHSVFLSLGLRVVFLDDPTPSLILVSFLWKY